MKYSAIVKDGNHTLYIRNEEHPTKEDFINSLEYAGFEVQKETVKESRLFESILLNGGTNWNMED